MEKKKHTLQVIIAHPDPAEQQRIASALKRGGVFSICHITHDGLDCLREVVSVQPDLLILAMVLEKIDGLEVLRRLQEFSLKNTKYMVIADHHSYLLQHAALAGADHCILTPFSHEVLAQRAKDLVLPPEVVYSDQEIDAQTVRVLMALGARENTKGYLYVLDGVRILVRDPRLVSRRRVTDELYGSIAKFHDLNNSNQVERAIRTLTARIFRENSAELLEQYFGPVGIRRARITNTDFLTSLTRTVTENLRSAEDAKADETT